MFGDTLGVLDAAGGGRAFLDVPPGLDGARAGIQIHTAYVVFGVSGTGSAVFTSNAASLQLVT